MSDFYETPEHCENCGHGELTVRNIYTVKRTFEGWIPCLCADSSNDIAAQNFYKSVERWEELGYLDDGWSKRFDRTRLEELPIEELEDRVHCQDCLDDASKNDWQTEEIADAEIIEGADAWMLFCNRCNIEVPFGWTQPNREGNIIPLSDLNQGSQQIWRDPGFDHRKLINTRQ